MNQDNWSFVDDKREEYTVVYVASRRIIRLECGVINPNIIPRPKSPPTAIHPCIVTWTKSFTTVDLYYVLLLLRSSDLLHHGLKEELFSKEIKTRKDNSIG